MKRIAIILGTALFLPLLFWLEYQWVKPDGSEPVTPTILDRVDQPWTGDLDEIIEQRRFIRVLVSYSQTNFFIDQGAFRGIEYELLKQYETWLNRDRKHRTLKTKVVFRVLPFDELLPALIEGQGDIAAAGLTITPQRAAKVLFTVPYFSDISEVLVTRSANNSIASPVSLSGRKVHVLAGSSYVDHLETLNQQLLDRFLPPVRVVEVDPNLQEEDLLQMVNAGIYEYTVADAHIAGLWAKVLDQIQVCSDITIHSGGEIAWALRPASPLLAASLNDFLSSHRQGTYTGNMLFRRYYENIQWIQNPLTQQQQDRMEALRGYFQKYAERYHIDWLKAAALAYQESRLDENAESHRGAVGIMQVLPSTAAGANIDIADIEQTENNIHAGIKYLAYLRDTYFNDPDIRPEHRIDFAIAAYNAGPARINLMRRKARQMGLNPNVWFSNVEVAARKFVGREPVQYVSNIYIYYVAYKSAFSVLTRKPAIHENTGLLRTDTRSDVRCLSNSS